jgi:hypothetical protein
MMKLTLTCIAPVAAAAVAAAIAVAPIAAAAPAQDGPAAGSASTSGDLTQAEQSCTGLGGTQLECQSPGNAQIYDSPPQVDYFPYAGGGT